MELLWRLPDATLTRRVRARAGAQDKGRGREGGGGERGTLKCLEMRKSVLPHVGGGRR